MAHNWSIIRAAVEQEILFPSQKALNDYIAKLEAADFPHQLIRSTVQEDGTVVALMRKRYNPINPFFPAENGNWIFNHQAFEDGGFVNIYHCFPIVAKKKAPSRPSIVPSVASPWRNARKKAPESVCIAGIL